MSRLPRLVFPGFPHHVTQRGNRREPIFFEPGDQDVYRDLLAEQAGKARVEIWVYCLMPNHVHLVAVPQDAHGLDRAIGEAHRRYTNFINARGRWTGHLFQNRFASVPMTSRISSRACVMSASIPFARGWWRGRKIGHGPASARISPAGTMG